MSEAADGGRVVKSHAVAGRFMFEALGAANMVALALPLHRCHIEHASLTLYGLHLLRAGRPASLDTHVTPRHLDGVPAISQLGSGVKQHP